MSITFTGTGGLFTRLGKMAGFINNINGFLGTSAPASATTWGASGPSISCVADATNGIEAQFASTNQQLIDTLYTMRDALRSQPGQFKSFLRTLAQNTAIAMANDDVVLPSKSAAAALAEILKQMLSGAYYVGAPTVSVVVTAGSSNNGTGACCASVIGGTGVNLCNVFAETIDVTCTSDSQVSSGLLGREPFSAAGDNAVSEALEWNWPAGSGATASISAKDATSTSDNLLTNGGFDTFTVANTPDNWTIAVGAAGTDIFSEASTIYGSSGKALKFTGTGGGPLSEIYQALTTLKANTVYCVNFWIRDSGAGLLAGVVQVDLHDGSAVINDDASTANLITRTFAQTTATYTAYNGFFRTPRVLPSTTRLRVKVTTALTSGESVYIDRLCFCQAQQVYTGGPFVQLFSGATKFVKNDTFAVAVSNNYSGKWHVAFEKLFGLRAQGLQLPISGSTQINDNLIA